MSINGGVDKDMIHAYTGILHNYKKVNAICSDMDGLRDCYTE